MITTKIYQYDSSQESNGYRGTDYSKYVLQGAEITEDITQELDTAELTLCGLNTNKEFEPESKFIIDIIETKEFGEDVIVQTHHFCVARDIVSQPILSDDTYFDHHISFIEPSVVAQKRLVDNIAVTYKLKDVSLKEIPAYPDNDYNLSITSSAFTPSSTFIAQKNTGVIFDNYEICTGKYFEQEGNLQIVNKNGEVLSAQYNNIENFSDGNGGYVADFILPKIRIMNGVLNSTSFTNIGYASLSYKIEEFNLNDEYNPTNVYSGAIISNSNLGSGVNLPIGSNLPRWFDKLDGEWLYEGFTLTTNGNIKFPNYYYKKYTEKSAPTPNYRVSNIPILKDKKYVVTVSLYQFPDNIPSYSEDGTYSYSGLNKLTSGQPYYFSRIKAEFQRTSQTQQFIQAEQNLIMVERNTYANTFMVTYDIETKELVYVSSTPYSALALLQKAIINSSIYEKKDGVYIADVNNSNLPFYIDTNYVDRLAATLIIENFYNQKNLWEIMLEVGNYIHSIPELKFGADDRFMITFNELGRTDEKQSETTNVSVFNSRSVEDYISATSSYITNMVQLGGVIEEWVVPKTTNETLLVSNDTAEIITSKPIIELLSITARNNNTGVERDLTEYIYEENVYKTLQIDYGVVPNRGIAMYYQLGKNVITGGQYQLPQANTNIYSDYAFKKVLYSAFNGYPVIAPAPTSGYWTTLNVKDYSFFVRYRTKDSVRQNHIRPDLRKYLLNSKYDKYPEHNQFNNQQDVVVDSIKFGNNMYGKLIKTGNNNYEKVEWADKYSQTKHKGELYRLNGELYYVAKVTHYYFSSYILSKTTYSKDYNELSRVIGIPSEPRFYEISEQSLIWRELALNDILLLTDDPTQLKYKSNFVFNFDHLSGLMIGEAADFAKYALTVYKGDKDVTSYDQTTGQPNLYKEVLNPINAYSSENTLTYEWDMEDNYSAGDKVIDTDKAEYNSLRAVGYTDIYGKAPLLDFYIIEDLKTPPTASEIKAFPESPIKTRNDNVNDTRPFIGDYNILSTNVMEYDTNFNGRGIGLLKDCREAMSINFNLQLATNSDTFVVSPYVFLPNKKNVRIVLLANEVNKLSNGYIDNASIITPIDVDGNTMEQYFTFTINKTLEQSSWDSSKDVVTRFGIDLASVFASVSPNHFNGTEGFQQVKAIAILCDVSLNTGIDTDNPTIPYKTQFIIARNIPSFWDKTKATSPIYFGAPNKDEIFKNKQ